MLLEVRLEKPSQPEKWDLPADISLRSALARAKQEAQSKLDGTMALGSGGTAAALLGATGAGAGAGAGGVAPDFGVTAGSTGMGGTMGATGTSTQQLTKRRSAGNPPSKPLPRHEMFLVNSTVVEVTAELHRALLPSTLADAVAASAALEGAHKEKGRARANATAAAASSPGANKSKGWSFFF
jgi:hypothetical protein